jgi:hypothetical protein
MCGFLMCGCVCGGGLYLLCFVKSVLCIFNLCKLSFNFVSYVFFLLCLCILIVMYALFCIFSLHLANWHSLATLTSLSVPFPQL